MAQEGSPPQVRGKLGTFSRLYDSFGITPAGAGKTLLKDTRDGVTGDHPRRCGENYEQLVGGVETLGSPPQVRGKP